MPPRIYQPHIREDHGGPEVELPERLLRVSLDIIFGKAVRDKDYVPEVHLPVIVVERAVLGGNRTNAGARKRRKARHLEVIEPYPPGEPYGLLHCLYGLKRVSYHEKPLCHY